MDWFKIRFPAYTARPAVQQGIAGSNVGSRTCEVMHQGPGAMDQSATFVAATFVGNSPLLREVPDIVHKRAVLLRSS